jgi:hypothetical protein
MAVAMPASLNMNGDCLYLFWAPEPTPGNNPYWLFVYLVSFLFVVALLLAVTGWKQDRLLNTLAGVVLALVLLLWAGDLADLWDAIQSNRAVVANLPLTDSGCEG